jgi:hypothetical protein
VARKTMEIVQFKLRITEGLRRQIEREAKKNNRSANNEAVARLERSFADNFASYQQLFEAIKGELDGRYVLKEESTPPAQQAAAASTAAGTEMINDEDRSVHASTSSPRG